MQDDGPRRLFAAGRDEQAHSFVVQTVEHFDLESGLQIYSSLGREAGDAGDCELAERMSRESAGGRRNSAHRAKVLRMHRELK